MGSTEWSIETVDAGRFPSIALDSDGIPHISYLNMTWGMQDVRLMYASRIGEVWSIEDVGTIEGVFGGIGHL